MTFEKRGVMSDRKELVSLSRLMPSLVLMALVLAAPVRSTKFVTVSQRAEGLSPNLALVPSQPMARLDAAVDTEFVMRVNALPSESEEQDWADALAEPRFSSPVPNSLPNALDRKPIASRSIPSLYPLRC